MNVDLSTVRLLRWIKWILPVLFGSFFILGVLFWDSEADIIEKYWQAGYISSDAETRQFLEEFIRDELSDTRIPNLSFGKATTPNTVSIYVLAQDPKRYFRLLPMNAGYDTERDAIFIEQSLVQLAMNDRACKTCRELLSFILLHELGHRFLHRDTGQRFDFISTSDGNSSFIFNFFNSDFTEHLRTQTVRDEEVKADEYAVDTYFQLKGEKGRSDVVPFTDLPIEGLFSRLTQIGPYSPLGDALTHPSIVSRIERIYSKLSIQPSLDEKTRNFFREESWKWMSFHLRLQNNLFSVLALPSGSVPVSATEVNGKIRIIDMSGRMFETNFIDLIPKKYKPFEILHKEAVDTGIQLPFSPSPGDKLFSRGKSYFFLRKTDNKLFRLNSDEWSAADITFDGDVTVLEDRLLTSFWDKKENRLVLTEVDLEKLENRVIREIYLKEAVDSALERIKFVPRRDGFSAVIYSTNNSVRIVNLEKDDVFPVLKQMDNVEKSFIDDSGRYFAAVVAGDKKKEDENEPVFADSGQDRIKIFDMSESRDVSMSGWGFRSELPKKQNQDALAELFDPKCAMLKIDGEELIVLTQASNSFPLRDKFLASAESANLINSSRIGLVNIPHSRYMLVLTFFPLWSKSIN